MRSGSLRQTHHCRDRCYLREAPGRHQNGCCGQHGETGTPHHRKAKLGAIMAHFASRPTESPLPRNSSLPHLIVQSPARRPVTSQRIEMIGAGEGNRTLVISLEGSLTANNVKNIAAKPHSNSPICINGLTAKNKTRARGPLPSPKEKSAGGRRPRRTLQFRKWHHEEFTLEGSLHHEKS